jgi:NAD(P)-dependent dehydrogenase (short-subunit alcohol dehydrogenase family)
MSAGRDPVAVVTGAGSGIGQATASALARRGLNVCCVGRRAKPLDDTVRALGAGSYAVAADVATEEGIAAIAAAVGDAPVTALVHAAAIEGVVTLDRTDRSTFGRLVATNLGGPFFLTQALAPRLADGRVRDRIRRQRLRAARAPAARRLRSYQSRAARADHQPGGRARAPGPRELRRSRRDRHAHDGRCGD